MMASLIGIKFPRISNKTAVSENIELNHNKDSANHNPLNKKEFANHNGKNIIAVVSDGCISTNQQLCHKLDTLCPKLTTTDTKQSKPSISANLSNSKAANNNQDNRCDYANGKSAPPNHNGHKDLQSTDSKHGRRAPTIKTAELTDPPRLAKHRHRGACARAGSHAPPCEHQGLLGAGSARRGYSLVYLGNVPTCGGENGGSTNPTGHLVEKILDRCNVQESRMKAAFLAVPAGGGGGHQGVLLYFVDAADATNRVYATKLFDLNRISYCQVHENGVFGEGSIVSWIYRQETDTGFQLQCHAVQCSTGRRAHAICTRLYAACQQLYQEVQLAMKTSRLFAEASKKLHPPEQYTPADGAYWNQAFNHMDEEDDVRCVAEHQRTSTWKLHTTELGMTELTANKNDKGCATSSHITRTLQMEMVPECLNQDEDPIDVFEFPPISPPYTYKDKLCSSRHSSATSQQEVLTSQQEMVTSREKVLTSQQELASQRELVLKVEVHTTPDTPCVRNVHGNSFTDGKTSQGSHYHDAHQRHHSDKDTLVEAIVDDDDCYGLAFDNDDAFNPEDNAIRDPNGYSRHSKLTDLILEPIGAVISKESTHSNSDEFCKHANGKTILHQMNQQNIVHNQYSAPELSRSAPDRYFFPGNGVNSPGWHVSPARLRDAKSSADLGHVFTFSTASVTCYSDSSLDECLASDSDVEVEGEGSLHRVDV